MFKPRVPLNVEAYVVFVKETPFGAELREQKNVHAPSKGTKYKIVETGTFADERIFRGTEVNDGEYSTWVSIFNPSLWFTRDEIAVLDERHYPRKKAVAFTTDTYYYATNNYVTSMGETIDTSTSSSDGMWYHQF